MKARVSKKNAPDIKSEEFFPSLGTENKPLDQSKLSKKDGFEEVKHGVKKNAQSANTSNPVSLDNAFSSLSNNSEEVDS